MKLISLNVEGSKHWERIMPFLTAEKPDVICFQEIFESDLTSAAKALSMEPAFAPMALRHYAYLEPALPRQPWGVAMLSRNGISASKIDYYHKTDGVLPYEDDSQEARRKTIPQLLLSADVTDADGGAFAIATTHFTWTPNGMPDRYQEEDLSALLGILQPRSDFVLCGDFNLPRSSNPLYKTIAARYRDAIPASQECSIDVSLHRDKNNPAAVAELSRNMVDYIFLNGAYSAEDVHFAYGVSDHYAVIATLHHTG